MLRNPLQYPQHAFGLHCYRYPEPAVVAPVVAPVTAPVAPVTAPVTPTWYDGFKDPAAKEWLGSYKDAYPDAEAVTLKALNLEKFITAEKAGRGVVVPKADAPAAEWRNFYAKVGGVPEKPEGYVMPKGMEKDPIMLKLQAHAHGIGMPASHWKAVTEFVAAEQAALTGASDTEFAKKSEAEMTEVRVQWGAQYDAKVEAGRRAAATLVPHTSKEELETVLNKMEGALGAKFTMNFWASLGEKMGEHGFVSGDNPTGQQTPESARLEIKALQGDKAFAKKVSDGDVEAKAQWDKLNRIAYGQNAQVLAVG